MNAIQDEQIRREVLSLIGCGEHNARIVLTSRTCYRVTKRIETANNSLFGQPNEQN